MDACPCCTAALGRSGSPHCDSPSCVWMTCGSCHARIAPDLDTYYGPGVWGDSKGYLKADQ